MYINIKKTVVEKGREQELVKVYKRCTKWVKQQSGVIIHNNIHGHRTLKAPHPVWSAQLSKVPPS
jgi:hypothetical protein